MEWVTGVKLTGLPAPEIQRLVAAGQEAFLTQLLEVGFFHGDPHPGNLLKVRQSAPHARQQAVLLHVQTSHFCHVSVQGSGRRDKGAAIFALWGSCENGCKRRGLK